MRKKTKRRLSMLIAMAFTLSLTATAMAADPGMNGSGISQFGSRSQGGMSNMQMGSFSQNGMNNLQMNAYSQGGMANMQTGPNSSMGMNEGGQFQNQLAGIGYQGKGGADFLTAAIDQLSDEDQSTLSEYIEAYETAVSAEEEAIENGTEGDDLSTYREAVRDAVKALLEAAKDADIDLVTAKDSQNGWGNQDFNSHQGKGGADFLAAAIDQLSDEDQSTLSEYIEAYKTAVSAEEEAIENGTEGDDLSTCREAVRDAVKALLEAAEDADIDLFTAPDSQNALGSQGNQGSNGNQGFNNNQGKGGADFLAAAIDRLSDGDQSTLSEYIEAYKTAVSAEKEAIENGTEGDDLSTCREAVRDAVKALLEAAKNAGIDFGQMKARK